MSLKDYIKGRGAQQNVHNKFESLKHTTDPEFLEHCHQEGEEPDNLKTRFRHAHITVHNQHYSIRPEKIQQVSLQ